MKANNEIRIMMKTLFSLLLLLSVSMNLQAQNPIAQLKFEDAEKAFNAGDYEKALHYVKETEDLAGVTSKTLYLKIVSQDKLVAGGQAQLLEALKANVQKYLTALASQEIDDKYRTVYEISKKLDDYATGKISPANIGAGDTFTPSDKAVADILTTYWKTVTGNVNPGSVRTIIIEKEITRNGSPFNITTIKKAIGRFSLEVKTNLISMKTVYNNGKGYMTMGSRQLPFGALQMGQIKKITSPGNLIPRLFDPNVYANATAGQDVFNGEVADVIKLPGNELYFNHNTHLLIAQKETSANGLIVTKTFQDYTSFQGIKLPATTITETVIGTGQTVSSAFSTLNKADEQKSQTTSGSPAVGLIGSNKKKNKATSQGTAALGLVGSSRKKKAKKQGLSVSQLQQVAGEIAKSSGRNTTTEITKIKSVQINEPIADEVFK